MYESDDGRTTREDGRRDWKDQGEVSHRIFFGSAVE